MKKLFAVLMCLCLVFVTGCSSSGISQEEYDALAAENSKLKSDYERVLAEKNDLTNEMNNVKSTLQQEINDLKNYQSNIDYCFDICTWMLGRPNSAASSQGSKHSDMGISVENTFYNENSEITAKSVVTFDKDLIPAGIAAFIKSYEVNAEKVMSTGITENVFIYRFSDGNVIASHYWYKNTDGSVNDNIFWTSYGIGVMSEFNKIS